MKTIPVEKLGKPLTLALERQTAREVITLTKDGGAVAWVVRVPRELQNADVDVAVIVHVKHAIGSREPAPLPVFGAGRGTMTIISNDEDHLEDFQAYMN